jgi:hypothetical protein
LRIGKTADAGRANAQRRVQKSLRIIHVGPACL